MCLNRTEPSDLAFLFVLRRKRRDGAAIEIDLPVLVFRCLSSARKKKFGSRFRFEDVERCIFERGQAPLDREVYLPRVRFLRRTEVSVVFVIRFRRFGSVLVLFFSLQLSA